MGELGPNGKRCGFCKEVKGRDEFNKNKAMSDGLNHYCINCQTNHNRNTSLKKRVEKEEELFKCPICEVGFFHLINHARQIHNMGRDELEAMGVKKFVSDYSRNKYIKAGQHLKPSLRRGEVIEIKKGRLTFPRSHWPDNCKFVKLEVHEKKVHLIPYLRQHHYTKPVNIPQEGQGAHRLAIRIPDLMLNSLDIERDIEPTKRKSFTIKFLEKDDELLRIFKIWAVSGQSLKNTSALTTNLFCKYPYFSIQRQEWPSNAEYAYLEWYPMHRKNNPGYIDILPVSRTGFIVLGQDLELGQYIGLEQCVKISPVKERLYIRPQHFVSQNNNIPSGDWDFVKTLPSGALRFRFYKER
jgi:hypothetical protein